MRLILGQITVSSFKLCFGTNMSVSNCVLGPSMSVSHLSMCEEMKLTLVPKHGLKLTFVLCSVRPT